MEHLNNIFTSINFLLLDKQVLEETINAGNVFLTGLITVIMYGLTALITEFIKKAFDMKKQKKEENKLDAESKNLNSSAKKADAETITEKAETDRTYIETARGLMEETRKNNDDTRKLFEDRVEAMVERQKNDLAVVIKKQEESDGKLAIITKEYEKIKNEYGQMKIDYSMLRDENFATHKENGELKTVIQKLQDNITKLHGVIKGLKNLVKKLTNGINVLISKYKVDHQNEIIPWEPILTQEEQILIQTDIDDLIT